MHSHDDRPIPFQLTAGYEYAPGIFDVLNQAAKKLNIDPQELNARCERDAERCGDIAVARLDRGVVAFKVQGEWRFRFPIRIAFEATSQAKRASSR
jgi:hypothetical protein